MEGPAAWIKVRSVCSRETSPNGFLLGGELANLSSLKKKTKPVRKPSYAYVVKVHHTCCNE